MKAKVIYKVTSLIVAFLVAVFTVGYAFAWILNRRDADFAIRGASAGAYFDSTSGDGTSEDEAFVISNATHMRNLAVLQNTGRFGSNKYYFKIKDSVKVIDMGSLWLPPIGNDDNPFRGEFNGNGKTISNLKVTTDKSLLTVENYPTQASPEYEFSNAVGLFGNTEAESVVRNFILDNPKVLVGDGSSTAYGSGANKTDKVAGIAVGRVAGLCQSIGVRATEEGATSLDIRVAGYSTFNSILGGLDAGLESSVTGGGHVAGSGGSGAAFGANFDVDGMYERLEKIEANKKSSNPAWRLPSLGNSSSDSITLGSLEKLPFTVTSESKYEGTEDREVVADNNIGYLLGNQNKVYRKNVTFSDKLVEQSDGKWTFPDGTNPSSGKIPRWIYRFSAENVSDDIYNSNSGFSALSNDEFEALPQGIKDLIPAQNGQITGFTSVRMSQTYQNVGGQIYPGSTSNGQWSPHGQISWNGKTYGLGLRGTTVTAPENNNIQDAVDENGIRYTADGNYLDDNNYEYNSNGYFVLRNWPLTNTFNDEDCFIDGDGNVVYDTEGEPIKRFGYKLAQDDNGYYLLKENGHELLYNVNGGDMRLQPHKGTSIALHRFTKGIALPNCGIWFKPIAAGKIEIVMYAEDAGDGFALIKGHRSKATKENPFYIDYSSGGAGLTSEEIGKYTLPSCVLFYFEFEVTEEDIADGRYEYWLMQYGSGGAYFVYMDLGASAAEDTSTTVSDTISAVDFIYESVEIEQADETIGIGNFIDTLTATRYESSKTSIYFEGTQNSLEIVYLRLHGRSDQKTIHLTNFTEATIATSEVSATYSRYVLPEGIKGGSGTVSGGNQGGNQGGNTGGDETVNVESVTINGAPATDLTVGDSVTLGATVTPANATENIVTWASSDSGVATVENGVVTAVSAGTVTITATAGDKSASVKITVNAKTVIKYNSDLSAETVGLADSTVITDNSVLGTGNAFIAFTGNSGSKVTYRTVNGGCLLIENDALSVTFKGAGKLTITLGSTGNTNNSRLGVKFNGEYIEASETGDATAVTTGAAAGCYNVVGTAGVTVTFEISQAGTYTISCPKTSDANRGGRIYGIVMEDSGS